MNGYGYVWTDGESHPNTWADGKHFIQVNCILCHDSGRQIDDDGKPLGLFCDCERGEEALATAMRELAEVGLRWMRRVS